MQNKCNIYVNTSNNHVNQTKQMQNKCRIDANTSDNHVNLTKQIQKTQQSYKSFKTNAKQMQHISKYK